MDNSKIYKSILIIGNGDSIKRLLSLSKKISKINEGYKPYVMTVGLEKLPVKYDDSSGHISLVKGQGERDFSLTDESLESIKNLLISIKFDMIIILSQDALMAGLADCLEKIIDDFNSSKKEGQAKLEPNILGAKKNVINYLMDFDSFTKANKIPLAKKNLKQLKKEVSILYDGENYMLFSDSTDPHGEQIHWEIMFPIFEALKSQKLDFFGFITFEVTIVNENICLLDYNLNLSESIFDGLMQTEEDLYVCFEMAHHEELKAIC